MLGALLGWSYRRSGTLLAPTIAHAVHNGAVLAIVS
jgi:membrane protease YdiL (CAAX protease family)